MGAFRPPACRETLPDPGNGIAPLGETPKRTAIPPPARDGALQTGRSGNNGRPVPDPTGEKRPAHGRAGRWPGALAPGGRAVPGRRQICARTDRCGRRAVTGGVRLGHLTGRPPYPFSSSPAAIAHIVQPTTTSSTTQARGRAKTGASRRAPYPSAVKKVNEAITAPSPKYPA